MNNTRRNTERFTYDSDAVPNQETLARWWVDLNRWQWPEDLDLGGAVGGVMRDHRSNVNGAMAVVDALLNAEGRALVDRLWGDLARLDSASEQPFSDGAA